MKQFKSMQTETHELQPPLAVADDYSLPRWPPISIIIALAVVVSLGLLGLVLGLGALLF